MADNINVTGMAGGTAENVNTAGVVHGGMGNKNNAAGNNITADKMEQKTNTVNTGGGPGCIAAGENAKQENIIHGQAPITGMSLTSAQLLLYVKQEECSEETIKIFEKKKVTGGVLLTADVDELMKNCGIQDDMDKLKLKALKKKLEGKP